MPVVLLVDGNVKLSRGLGKAMTSGMADLEVLHARTCDDAIKVAVERMPHVVVSDWLLPDGSGFTLMFDIHAISGSIPVILQSDESTPEFRAKAISHGAFDVLEKHIEASEVLSAIHRALGPPLPVALAEGGSGAADTDAIIDKLSGLLIGLRAFDAELRARAGKQESVNHVVDRYLEDLVDKVHEISRMVNRVAEEDQSQ
jgi:two-component system phosphate regulon response regulator PhoB